MTKACFPVLGVLIDWLTMGYQIDLINGINSEAKKKGINVIYFPGRQFNTPVPFEIYHNRLYELLHRSYLDGLIIPVTMMDYVQPAEYDKYLGPYEGIPLVTLSFSYKNFPSVNIDNQAGFKVLVEHMIEKHGFRKFAYIHGPENHPEAAIRFKTFQEVLISNNIDMDKNKVFYGPFVKKTGILAVETLLDKNNFKIGQDIDAFICANDFTALGVIQAVEKRGFSVPEDVAVTGFDNIERGRTSFIPLTTIMQPTRELGREAVKVFARKKRPEKLLPTRFLQKGTCGCLFVAGEIAGEMDIPEGMGLRDFLHKKASSIFSSYRQKKKAPVTGESIPGMMIALFTGRGSVKRTVTMETLEDIKKKIFNLLLLWIEKWDNLEGWEDFFNLFRNCQLPDGTPAVRERLFRSIYKLVSGLSQRINMKNRKKMEQLEFGLRSVNEGMSAGSQLDDISMYLSACLPKYLGINNCYMFLYNTPGNYYIDFKLLNNESRDNITDTEYNNFRDFETIIKNLLLPQGRFSVIVHSLVVEDVSMGLVIMNYNEEAMMTYESLCIHISMILKHSYSIIESENKNKKLKKLQGKLVQSAHQAGMANIAINLMHSVDEILNSIFTSLDQLKERLNKPLLPRFRQANNLLRKNLDTPDFFYNHSSGKLLLPYYRKLAEILGKENEILRDNTRKLEKKISEIVKLVDSQNRLVEGVFIYERINLTECLEDSLTFKDEAIKRRGIRLLKNYETMNEYMIVCYRNKLLHAFTKLLEGAIHRTDEAEEKKISITLKHQANHVLLEIANTGRGIAKSDLKKIFAQAYEGPYVPQGEDLHSIANSLAEINASIRTESEGPDRGAVFIIDFNLEVH